MFRITNSNSIKVNENLSKTGGTTLFQWFPQWWGWYASSEPAEPSKTPDDSQSGPLEDKINSQIDQLEDEILDVIADTIENNTILRRDTVFGQFNFTLKEGGIRLNSLNCGEERLISLFIGFAFFEFPLEMLIFEVFFFSFSFLFSSANSKCVMELLFNNVRLELESRPRSSSSRVHVSLGSVILNDYLTENSVFPVLISPQSK